MELSQETLLAPADGFAPDFVDSGLLNYVINMVFYQRSDSVAGAVAFACSVLSVLSCAVVLYSIHLYQKKKISYHLQLVGRLLSCDIGISSCVILYFIFERILPSDSMDDFCNIFLPITVFFFLGSFGWTIMLALRFRSSHDRTADGSSLPFLAVWTPPIVLTLALAILIWAIGNVAEVQHGDSKYDKACTFNHDEWNGVILDVVVFQTPIVLTILLNTVIYGYGLAALGNAPHSVLARQMHKAGGYLAVLVIVWVPNVVYNTISIADLSDRDYTSLLDLSILLTSIQVSILLRFYSTERSYLPVCRGFSMFVCMCGPTRRCVDGCGGTPVSAGGASSAAVAAIRPRKLRRKALCNLPPRQ